MHFPFFILPFDHRAGFAKELLNTKYPYSKKDLKRAIELKQMIWEAFLIAKSEAKTEGELGILVDEESGVEILQAAKKEGVPSILTVEKSGESFDFIHGEEFGDNIKRVGPTFAKALLRYNLGEEEINVKQRENLKKLSDFCKNAGVPLLIEVLIKDHSPIKLAATIVEFEKNGITCDIWKLEGFSDPKAWEAIAAVTKTPVVVLGHGEGKEEVESWVKAGAQSKNVKGFAIGRTVFLDPLKDFVSGKIDKSTAERAIADNFLYFIKVWDENAS